MVVLKRVELLGFKSFPERTIVEFSDGISAIVGPNGCGKSNVVDAVRWALGEQNPRMLRAEKMEDIVFGGTEARSRLGVAEVTLVLDNESGLLPVDATEVEVRRRLYRSGESEYLINRSAVRMRDVRELFLDTGVGKSAYSIMEQGRIDMMLSSKPEERRQVFEEAAGIARYRARGAEAERRLAQTRDNMREIEAILVEIRRSRETLAEQMERAKQFRQLQERIFGAERDMELIRLRELEDRRAKVRVELSEAQASRNTLREQRRKATEAVKTGASEIKRKEQELVDVQRQLYGVDLKRSSLDEQIATARERVEEIERSMATYRDRDRAVVAKIEELETSLADKRREAREADARLEHLETAFSSTSAVIDGLSEQVRDNEQQIADAADIVRRNDSRLEELRGKLRSITDDIVASLDAGLEAVGYSPEARAAAEQDIATVIAELRNTLSVAGGAAGGAGVAPASPDAAALVARLQTAGEQLTRLEGLIQSYERLASSFIDDFLSPTGIVTQKRELDDELGATFLRIADARKRAEECRQANRKLGIEIDRRRHQIERMQVERARFQTLKGNVDNECQRLETDISEQHGLRSELGKEEEAAAQAIQALATSLGELESQRTLLGKEEAKLRERLAELEGELHGDGDSQESRQREIEELQDKIEAAATAIEQLQLADTEVATEIRTTHRNFQETHAQDLSQYELELTQADSRGEVREVLDQLREQVRALGHVNLMAPEQYREVDERFQFLRGQLDDLETASADLEKVTHEIRTESTLLFSESFKEIRGAFQTVFRRLFGGGRTELRLTDPEDVLSSGIEFYAQPPGKKLENIELLSGGERALTAVSLLFAIYTVRPSPFCMLDEIDAALDDENVGRLVELLGEFSSATQFLVITHNKRTAGGAGYLYGITMEEKGVSRLVTLRLPHAERARSEANGTPVGAATE